MNLPYYKNNELQAHWFEIADNIWKGCRSKYQKVRDRNMNKMFQRCKFYHPTLVGATYNYHKGFVATRDAGVSEHVELMLGQK